ncbi:MAG: GyrI-like domain-containing protein [Planctomycetota bacterium]
MFLPFDPCAPLLLGALVLFSSILRAQSPAPAKPAPPPPDPALTALLDKVAASHGIAPGVKTNTFGLTGTYSVAVEGQAEPVGGAFGEKFVGTDLARHVSDLGHMGTMESGVFRDLVWAVDPHMGAKVHTGGNAAASRRYFAMLRGDDPRTLYREIKKTGSEKIGGREHTVLEMIPAEGKPDTWVVDADGNVVRIDTALPAPESADAVFGLADLMPTTLTFANWQQVEGGRFPMLRTLRMGPATVTTTISKAIVGVEIEAEKFEPPAAVAKVTSAPSMPAFGPDGKPNYHVIDRQPQAVASIRIKVKASAISEQLGILLPEVMTHLNVIGARMAGAPFSRYHAFTGDEIDLEAGIPVQSPITEKGRVKNSELPGGKTVTCWHVGSYDKLGAAHAGLQAHLADKKLKARGGVWELYWTDPGMVPDPAKWKTQLFAPIE